MPRGTAAHWQFVKIDIDRLNYAELIDLDNRIVERLEFLDQMQSPEAMLRFRLGQRVTFTPVGRPRMTGIIARFNRKTIPVITEDGQRWRVAPQFVSTTDSPAGDAANVGPPGCLCRGLADPSGAGG